MCYTPSYSYLPQPGCFKSCLSFLAPQSFDHLFIYFSKSQWDLHYSGICSFPPPPPLSKCRIKLLQDQERSRHYLHSLYPLWTIPRDLYGVSRSSDPSSFLFQSKNDGSQCILTTLLSTLQYYGTKMSPVFYRNTHVRQTWLLNTGKVKGRRLLDHTYFFF